MHEISWEGLSKLIQGLPSAGVLFGKDKTALGKFSASLEQFLKQGTQTGQKIEPLLVLLVETLQTRLDEILLDETEYLKAVTQALPALAVGMAAHDAAAVLKTLGVDPEIAKQGDTGSANAAAQKKPEELSDPDDIPNITTDEDVAIYREFILESSEHLERIEETALEIESSGLNPELVGDMFRCFHSMKGAAGFLGLMASNGLCHEAETLLDRLRKMTLPVTSDVIEVLLEAIDTAKRLLTALNAAVETRKDGVAIVVQKVSTSQVRARIREILNAAPGSAEKIDKHRLGGMLVAEGAVTEQQLLQALAQQQRPVGQILVDMGATTSEKVQETVSKTSGKLGGGSIKVDTARLDNLLEMVGELVIAQTLVAQDPALIQDHCQVLAKNIVQLTSITTRMQELVMSLRLVPLRQTFHRMSRLVRDTSRKTSKEVKLVITGEDTEIDKTVCEELGDPLIHMLRNAVDHGCELPEEREIAGKPREATVWLSAYHQGGNVIIEIRDDGAGLNFDCILEKAREKGLIGPDEEPDEDKIASMIFAAGFSTAKTVTDLSGRGVGMDVVRRNIERLGGRVEVISKPGKGTTFLIRLPLTMAIVDGMVVCVGQERYILPTLGIEESLRPRKEQISTVAGKGEVILIRGELVPLMRLASLFGQEGRAARPWEGLVIILNAHGRKSGIVVDDLLGQQQVVIKNMGAALQGIAGISGACILGDGRVGLILDVPGLIEMTQERESHK